MPNINHIRSFVAIVDHGCFSHAATSLNVSQATLTKRIKHLEGELDCQLFNRTTRQVTLSSSGHVLLNSWTKCLNMYDLGIDSLKEHLNSIRPTLKIGLNNISIRTIGEEFVKKVGAMIPDVSPSIILSPSHQQIQMIKDGRLDVGFIADPEDPDILSDIASLSVLQTPMKLICNVENRISLERIIKFEMLAEFDHVCGMHDVYISEIEKIKKIFKSKSLKWNVVREHLHTDSIFSAIRKNKKLVAIHALQKDTLLPAGLTYLDIIEPSVLFNILFIWDPSTNSPNTIQAVDLIKQIVSAQP